MAIVWGRWPTGLLLREAVLEDVSPRGGEPVRSELFVEVDGLQPPQVIQHELDQPSTEESTEQSSGGVLDLRHLAAPRVGVEVLKSVEDEEELNGEKDVHPPALHLESGPEDHCAKQAQEEHEAEVDVGDAILNDHGETPCVVARMSARDRRLY